MHPLIGTNPDHTLRQPGGSPRYLDAPAHVAHSAPETPGARSGSAPLPLTVRWARHQDEVEAAQRLRFQVFAQEMGARLNPPYGTAPGLDVDAYDAHAEHLIVLAPMAADEPEAVVGTYRLLTPQAACRTGGYYTESEFQLHGLDHARPHLAELGRSCVHPAHRTGGVILALWGALVEFLLSNRLQGVLGCASVSMQDGGHNAASLWARLQCDHAAAPDHGATPHCPLPVWNLERDRAVEPPPLIRGYLRCGARLLGAPAWDADFNMADLPLLLNLADLPSRYRRHFLQGSGN